MRATVASKQELMTDNVERQSDVELAMTAIAYLFSGECPLEEFGKVISKEINSRLYKGNIENLSHPLGWSWDERGGTIEQVAVLLCEQEGIQFKSLPDEKKQHFRAMAMNILELLEI